jgi:hypothetical protein
MAERRRAALTGERRSPSLLRGEAMRCRSPEAAISGRIVEINLRCVDRLDLGALTMVQYGGACP